MKENCLHCDEKLFSKVILDSKGSMAMDKDDSLEKQFDGTDHYYICPACGWENIEQSAKEGGLNVMKIVKVRPPSNR